MHDDEMSAVFEGFLEAAISKEKIKTRMMDERLFKSFSGDAIALELRQAIRDRITEGGKIIKGHCADGHASMLLKESRADGTSYYSVTTLSHSGEKVLGSKAGSKIAMEREFARRVSGDSFTCAEKSINAPSALSKAQRIRSALQELSIAIKKRQSTP